MAAYKPSLVMMAIRVAVITVLATLLSFAVTLLFSIVGVALANLARAQQISMTYAYRHIAFPVAIAVLVIALIAALVMESRQYRRQRAAWRELSRAA